jgi:hypothetical protein
MPDGGPTDDLWPPDLFQALPIRPPVLLLREAAEGLTMRSNRSIQGEVQTAADGSGNQNHSLNGVAPALSYRWIILRVKHTIAQLYPADVILFFPSATNPQVVKVTNEDELREVLRHTFSLPETRKLIGTLLAQIQSIAEAAKPTPPTA